MEAVDPALIRGRFLRDPVAGTLSVDAILHRINAYIFEFKVQDENPLQQIKTMRYYEKYAEYSTWLIGIVFDVRTRNITQFVYEQAGIAG